jgi:hypothetical protein
MSEQSLIQRDEHGHFVKGNNLHQTSKRRAGPATLLRKITTDEQREEFLLQMWRDAQNPSHPDYKELRFWLAERIAPRPRSVAPLVKFELDISDPKQAADDIACAVAAGEIASDQAKDLIQSLTALYKFRELEELSEQVQALKERIDENDS